MNQATETPTAAQAVTPIPKDTVNGVTRPKAGTTCGRVWAICDEQSAAANAPAERAKVIEQATSEGINAATVATQHGKWRKYHGLVADSPEAKAEKAAAVAEAKVEKEAAAKTKKDLAAKTKADKTAAKKAEKDAAAAKASDITAEATDVVEAGAAA